MASTSTGAKLISSTLPVSTSSASVITQSTSRSFQIHRIEDFYSRGYRGIADAFWSEDGRTVFYAIGICDEPLIWFAYDLEQRSISRITLNLYQYDRSIWQTLNTQPPDASEETNGYVSPSGRHIIYQTESAGTIEWWIVETSGSGMVKFFEAEYGGLGRAIWIENESRLIFNIYDEYGGDLYVASVLTGEATYLTAAMSSYWSVSPDEEWIAYIGMDGYIWRIPIDGGVSQTTSVIGEMPQWSDDGQSIFYWRGESWNPYSEFSLSVYDVDSRNVSVILDHPALVAIFPESPTPGLYSYAIAPDDLSILFYDSGWLWVVAPQD